MSCKKCDYTGLAYGNIPCECQAIDTTKHDPPKCHFVDHKTYMMRPGDIVYYKGYLMGEFQGMYDLDSEWAIIKIVYNVSEINKPAFIWGNVRINIKDITKVIRPLGDQYEMDK